MSDADRALLLALLAGLRPEADLAALRPDALLRDELDLDSMDFLNFVLALHERLGIEIPEADYPRLYTLDKAVAYLGAKIHSSADG